MVSPVLIARLSDGERACLRLVFHRFRSKEIAHQLAITPEAADKRIQSARAKLGGLTRRDAAIALAIAENGDLQFSEIDFSALPPPSQSDAPMASPDRGAGHGGLHETPAAYAGGFADVPTAVPTADRRSTYDDRGSAQQIWGIVKATVAAAVALLIIVAVAQSITSIWRSGNLEQFTTAPD